MGMTTTTNETREKTPRWQEQADMLMFNKTRHRDKTVLDLRHLYVFRWGCGHLASIITDEPMDRREEQQCRFSRDCPTCAYVKSTSEEAVQARIDAELKAKAEAEEQVALLARREKQRAYMARHKAKKRLQALKEAEAEAEAETGKK